MDAKSQRDLQELSIDNLSKSERLHYSHARKALDCHSTRGPVAPDCPLESCYFCADLATIDNEISTAYENIFNLIQKRNKITRKPNHNTSIRRVPVEILSLIFIFVKEAYDDIVHNPSFCLPYRSPPLLVDAVCRQWREITLRTPQLWTDIKVDMEMPVSGQLNMVKEWARRSGALPVNIQIFLPEDSDGDEDNITEDCKAVVRTLRSFAFRWNDVAIRAPWSVCYELFDELQESPSISSLHLFVLDWDDDSCKPVDLQHPLCPKYFYSWTHSEIKIPFEWGNLVHIEVGSIPVEAILRIIHQAQNLRHCEAKGGHFESDRDPQMFTTRVVNHSLIYLETDMNVAGFLTLPSLQHLDYFVEVHEDLETLVGFIGRSRPPLEQFILGYLYHTGDPNPCFKNLPGITSLFITDAGRDQFGVDLLLQALLQPFPDAILPRLTEFSVYLLSMTPSSWSLLSRLFKDIQLNTPHLKKMKTTSTFGRPLSTVRITTLNDSEMDKDTFLRLLEVKKMGLVLDFKDSRGDLLRKMAKRYDVQIQDN